ncbi:MAG TPA: DUF4384 domain-containing protein [Gemmatimonadales bacterium]|nr:DUF4384 domain-containing protein [Gemmatimonadales bacterium]
MISALLVPLALLAGPAAAPASPAARADDPAIRLWLSDDARYVRGDEVKVQVRTRDDGYVVVLRVDTDGRLRVLFPLDPGDDNFVRGGDKFEVKGRGDRQAFRVDAGSGQGAVYAAVSPDPFQFTEFVAGDHWDFRALNDVRIGNDVEADINDFVRRIATRDYDYDLMRYDVYDRVAYDQMYGDNYYGSTYLYPSYGLGCFGYWNCGYAPFGTSIAVAINFGHPHRRFFYDPFFFDPFFNPFFPGFFSPSPFFFHPHFRNPHVFRPPYVFGGPRGGFFNPPWRRRDPGVSLASSSYLFGHDYGPGRLIGSSYSGGSTFLGGRTTARRSNEPRSLDMTPTRAGGRRRNATGPAPVRAPDGQRVQSGRVPAPAPAPTSAGSAPLPVRVGSPARARGPVGEPRRLNDDGDGSSGFSIPHEQQEMGLAPRGRRANADIGDDGDVRDDGSADGYELPRVYQPHTPERRPVEARPAEPRAREPRSAEPRPIERPAPSAPRMESPRRMEPRPEARPQMDPGRRAGPEIHMSAPRGPAGGGGGRRASPRR